MAIFRKASTANNLIGINDMLFRLGKLRVNTYL